MRRSPHERFTLVLSGGGNDEWANFHLTIGVYSEGKEVWSANLFDGRVQLEGGDYDHEEWVREVLVGLIEKL